MLPAPRSAQNRLHSRKKLRQAEWLRHIIIGAKPEAENLVGFLAARGEDEHRHFLPFRAKLLEDGVTVHSRKHQIEHDQIGVPVPRELQALQAVLYSFDIISFGLEAACEPKCKIGIVLDDKNP